MAPTIWPTAGDFVTSGLAARTLEQPEHRRAVGRLEQLMTGEIARRDQLADVLLASVRGVDDDETAGWQSADAVDLEPHIFVTLGRSIDQILAPLLDQIELRKQVAEAGRLVAKPRQVDARYGPVAGPVER